MKSLQASCRNPRQFQMHQTESAQCLTPHGLISEAGRRRNPIRDLKTPTGRRHIKCRRFCVEKECHSCSSCLEFPCRLG